MMIMLKAWFAVYLYVLCALSVNGNGHDVSTLKFAIIVFRHGQRSPDALYPKDPHKNYTWTGGFGALTEEGRHMLYELGLKSRDRYQVLFPSNQKYTTDDIYYCRSSAIKRCQNSAKSFLDGFLSTYKDPFTLQRNIHVVARKKDTLILQKARCPKYDKMLKNIYTLPSGDLKKYIDDNKELFNYLGKHTGKNESSILRGEQVYDILNIQQARGLDLPDWAKPKDIYPKKLKALAGRCMAILTENDFMKRIKGGYLITNIVDKMTQKSKNPLSPKHKLFFYSGHDTTLMSVMRALNITSPTTNKPDFAASLTFELHASINVKDRFEIRMFYRANPESDLQRLSIPLCHRPCTLTAFTKAVKHLIVRDYNKECDIVPANNNPAATKAAGLLPMIVWR